MGAVGVAAALSTGCSAVGCSGGYPGSNSTSGGGSFYPSDDDAPLGSVPLLWLVFWALGLAQLAGFAEMRPPRCDLRDEISEMRPPR